MGKKNKDKYPSGVSFELEDDAKQIFLDAIDDVDANAKNEELSVETQKSKQSSERQIDLDLHGLSLSEAKSKVETTIESHRSSCVTLKVKVVTGKGRHSGSSGSVLPRGVHDFVCQRFGKEIVSLEECPDDVMVNGLPIRGHFNVVIRFKTP